MSADPRAGSSDSGALLYDGFISYSHAADDLLAPRLQAGLQKFAKPWWKRRAVRIFRDESSLAANPHLWSSIAEALESSSWFVLLLSPDAANSEWVGKEIKHWVANKPADRILPVVTDGDFGWFDGEVKGSSVPPALHGVFAEEPRLVDLRFAKGDENLDLQNPDFLAAVADIASAIRGVPKDELASEEVRQHRRTVRTAWAAGITVTVLAAVAIVAGIFAIGQRNDARDNAALAQANATAEAEARKDADANAALAEARELAASAINVLDEDPELSILLSLQAIDGTPAGQDQPVEVIDALWQAVQTDRLEAVVETGYGDGTFVALSPDDATLFVVNGFPAASGFPDVLALQAYSTSDFEKLWEYRVDVAEFGENGVPDGDRLFLFLHVSPDGDRVSLGLRGVPARFLVLSASDGEILHNVTYPDCAFPFPWGWSPDGTVFAVTGICPQDDDGSIEAWTEILDGDTFAPLSRTASAPFDGLSFDGSGRLFAFSADAETTVFSPPDYQDSTTLQGVRGIGDVSMDGSVVVTIESPADPCQLGLALNRRADCGTLASFATSTGERIDLFTPLPALPPIEGMLFGFSGAERLFAVPTQGAKTLVWDIATGEQIAALPSGEGVNAAVSSDGRRVYTGGVAGDVMVWDLSPNVGLDGVGDVGNFPAIGVNTITSGQTLGAFVATDPGSYTSQIFFFDLATGALVGEPASGQQPIVPLTGDRFLITDPYVGAPPNPYVGSVTPYSWSIYDPMTGDRSRIAGCDLDLGTGLCPDGQPPLPYFWAASFDGSELVRFFPFGPFTLFDPTSGDPVGELTPDGSFLFVGAFTDDWIAGASQTAFVMTDRKTGETLVSIETNDRRFEGDSETLAFVAPDSILLIGFETREQSDFLIELGRVQGIAVDTGLRRIALGDENGVHVFDFDGQQLASIPIPGVADLHWISENRILVGTRSGTWATVSLLNEDLISSARVGVTRGFTAAECATYRIDPCPSLEMIQTR